MYIFRVRNAPNMTANPIFLVPSLATVKPCSFNKFSQYHRSKTDTNAASRWQTTSTNGQKASADPAPSYGCLIRYRIRLSIGFPPPSSLRDLQIAEYILLYIIYIYVIIFIQIPRIVTFQNYFLNYLASRYADNTNQMPGQK